MDEEQYLNSYDVWESQSNYVSWRPTSLDSMCLIITFFRSCLRAFPSLPGFLMLQDTS